MECCEKYKDAVFTFGSNEGGIHGRGAALHALVHHGAVHGQGAGWQGIEGRSYAIPTKDRRFRTLPLPAIRLYVEDFLKAASQFPDDVFYVTAIGTGLAKIPHEQIAPMFADAPLNCILPKEWLPWTRPNREGG